MLAAVAAPGPGKCCEADRKQGQARKILEVMLDILLRRWRAVLR